MPKMKYCLFCRDSFPDDASVCPRCGGELSPAPPDPDDAPDERDDELDDDSPEIPGEPAAVDPDFQGPLVPVAFIKAEEDLRAAVAVLTEHGIYFEIDEAESTPRIVGLSALGRGWRLLVREEEGPDAFLRLVKAMPHIFPDEIAAEAAEADEHEAEYSLAADVVVDLLHAPVREVSGDVLAKAIITAFSGDDSESVARAKYALARRGEEVAPLLSEIAAQAAAQGGEGAEAVLYNVLEILEALGDTATLPKLEALYSSAHPQVRARAAYAAGRLGAPEAVDALLALLSDADEDTRYEASEAIWRLTGIESDFDPYHAPAEEYANVQSIRDAWARSDKKSTPRSRANLADLLRTLGETLG
jgi:hypothetical protein